MLIPVLLKIGYAEWSVHGGDAHGAREKDMLDVSLAPIYLDIYLQDLRIWIKFCNKFCIKDLVVVSNVWDKVHSCVMNKLVVLAQWMKSFGWLRIKLFSLILVDIITIIYNIMIKVFSIYCPRLIMFKLFYENTCVNFIAMKLKYVFWIVSITYMFVVISYRWN
jgi:hypothetical protein